MSGLDSLIMFLQQRRQTYGDQIDMDMVKTAFLDKEIAKKQVMVDSISASWRVQARARYYDESL